MVNINKNNILFLFHSSNLNNGATRSMIDVIENLIKRPNVKIVVLYPDKKGTAIKYLNDLGVKTYKIYYGRWDYYPAQKFIKKMFFFIKSFLKQLFGILNIPIIIKIIRKEKIDLVYTNTSVIYEGALLSKLTKIKHIWHIREFGREDHGFEIIYGKKIFMKFLNKNTDAVIFISDSIRQKFISMINNTNTYVIYNDISKKFINRKKQQETGKKLKMAIIGTIQEGKGQYEVIKAVKILRNRNLDIELHIAGEETGEYYKKLKDYVKKNNLEKYVLFDGFIRNVNEYRQQMDIGIVASSNEAFGRVTIEGMLSQMLMIGANCGGTKELIKDNFNGILYELHNENDLAEKIERFYDDRFALNEIANNGFNYAVKEFTEGKAAEKIYAIMQLLIDGGK